mgnify:CR=1 FL=1
MLLILPWTRYWDDNFFLFFITGKLQAPRLFAFLTSGWVRGAVTGLGLVNILAGLRDVLYFGASVQAMSGSDAYAVNATDGLATPVNLPDHRPPSAPPPA